MSQMSRSTALSRCPSCEEPLESGDLYCGACGYDLSVVPAPPADPPTLTMNGAVPRPDAEAASVDWPAAPAAGGPQTHAPVHLPTDIPGTDSGGSDLPLARGVRFDRPAEPDD